MTSQTPTTRSLSRRQRPMKLVENLEGRLIAYSFAAGAAGVGLMVVQPAAAEVIYTQKDVQLSKGVLYIDLNDDGMPDFNIGLNLRSSFTYQDGHYHVAKLAVGGDMSASVIPSNGSAAALAPGAVIGQGRKFINVHSKRGQMLKAWQFSSSSGIRVSSGKGNWKNAQSRFLGLKFQINGETHYGWARLSVNYPGFFQLRVTLLGYAYESNPDMAIVAGQTSGTLGALALGAAQGGKQ